MILTLSWLKNHLSTKASINEIIEKLTNIGLEVEGLKKYYDELKVIHNFSLNVENGERIAVIGKNGIGKTTLLESLVQNIKINLSDLLETSYVSVLMGSKIFRREKAGQ